MKMLATMATAFVLSHGDDREWLISSPVLVVDKVAVDMFHRILVFSLASKSMCWKLGDLEEE